MRFLITASLAFLLQHAISSCQEQEEQQHHHHHALYIKNEFLEQGKRNKRQTNADQMVQNILQWLQEVYTQGSRRIRQGSLREYLPPSNTQRPRPFETPSPISSGNPNQYDPSAGYPAAGSITPQPPFNPYPAPNNEIIPPGSDPYSTSQSTAGSPQQQQPYPYPTPTTSQRNPFTSPIQQPSNTYLPSDPTRGFSTNSQSVTSTQPYPYPSNQGGQTTQNPYLPSNPTTTQGYPSYPSQQSSTTNQPYNPSNPNPTQSFPFSTQTSTTTSKYPYPPASRPTASTQSPYPSYTSGSQSQTNYPTNPTTTSYPTSQGQRPSSSQQPAYRPPTQQSGFTSSTQQPGYPASNQQSGYPSRPQQSGYPTRPQQSGYPNRPQQQYPTTQSGSGFSTAAGSTQGGGGSGGSYTQTPSSTPGYQQRPGSSSGYTPSTGQSSFPPGGTESNYNQGPSGSGSIGSNQIGNNIAPDYAQTPNYQQGSSSPSGFSPTTPGFSPSPSGTGSNSVEDDLNHPPHIHSIDVQCAKDMMRITIEFNREFNGVIYSKGYYNMPECRYVNVNSEQIRYTFTVSLNSCGTDFVNAFDTQGQSYLENVLVLQNEPGIQEVWDTIRSVRCLWEGNLKESLSVALSVSMLNQEVVTFSGDTAMAKLDIQMGRGPFAPPANGLVKIGEIMTLVVSVAGDPGFDIQVKDCRATDAAGVNVVPLTDENGCVLKPKVFGAFQKTRNTANTGASIMAYAYFSAFKFPDVMDLMIECNIELCKTDCEMCPNPNQKLEPGARKRRRRSANDTESGVTMGKHLRVVLPEDLSHIQINHLDGVCMTTANFVLSAAVMVSLLVGSSVLSASLYLNGAYRTHKAYN